MSRVASAAACAPFLLLLLLCAWPAAAAQGQRLPGSDYVGLGVDITKVAWGGNYLEAGNEGALKGSVLLIKNDDLVPLGSSPDNTTYLIPRNTVAAFLPGARECAFDSTTTHVGAAREYQREMERSFSIGIGIPGLFSCGLSIAYRETTEILMDYDQVIFDQEAACEAYTIGAKNIDAVAVRNNFESRLLELPKAFDNLSPKPYMDFIASYGTHVAATLQAGGMMAQRITLSSFDYSKLKSKGMDVSAQASVTFGVSVQAKDTHSENTTQYVEFSKVAHTEQVVVTGGQANIVDDFAAWNATLMQHPVMMRVEAVPLERLMTRDRFGGNQHISERAASFAQASQYYQQTHGTIPGLLPRSFVVQSAGEQKRGVVSASCPAGTVMLGGGCDTEKVEACHETEENDGCWPWRVTASYPSSANTWTCKVNQDWGKAVEYQTPRATVLCADASVMADRMGPPYYQSVNVTSKMFTCESGEAKDDSSCTTPACPSDMIVTGGGCKPSDADDDLFPHQVTASVPAGDAWKCSIRRDYGGSGASAKAQGWVMCSNWTGSFQYRPPHYSVERSTCNSGSANLWDNDCTASCPDGYVVVGGGCDAGVAQMNSGIAGAPAEPQTWRVSRSMKRGNGWYCEGGEDNRSKWYKANVSAVAICMRFNLADNV